MHTVRDEARAAQLAYGFLRGRTYATIETPKWKRIGHRILGTFCVGHSSHLIPRIVDLTMKYGSKGAYDNKKEAREAIERWIICWPE